MNRDLLDKNLDVFPQNSTFFIQIITLKIDVILKSLAMQFSIIVWVNFFLERFFGLK